MSHDFDLRELCSDGSCIGIIGPDGRCKECGRPASTGAATRLRSEDSGPFSTNRALCPNGACVGIIGADGRCKECGAEAADMKLDPRIRGLRSDDEVREVLEANIARSDLAAAPEDWSDRRLCSDGACIGIIGTDDRCRVCGKPSPATP